MYRKFLKYLLRILNNIHKNSESASIKIRHQLYFLDFEERESDIFVVTYLKSGTTWMQVILHNLLTDGNMDFNHIYDVSPWPRNQSFKFEPVEKINKMPSPRIMKSHDEYNFYNKDTKGKIIYVYRDGKDVAVSLYHHNKNYLDPDLTFDGNFEEFFTQDNAVMNWFKFNNEWLENKNNLNILFVSYEQLTNNFDATLQKIAAFVEVNLTDEIIARVKEHTSFEYMKKHESKFGEVTPIHQRKVFNQFIRKGKTGEGNEYMNEKQKAYFEKKYEQLIKPYVDKLFF